MNKIIKKIVNLLLITPLVISLSGCSTPGNIQINSTISPEHSVETPFITLDDIPEYDGSSPYVILNNNQPFFTEEELSLEEPFEEYPELDELGRCQSVWANLDESLMPTEDRESIGMIKPSGWKTAKYDFVDGKYLYNRCHLIGFQLAGENANERNLITGTRYMNVEGMLPFENMVGDYLRDTGESVLYRVTPIFKDDELVARGVVMEAYSQKDNGEGICFNVFVYNVQPGVEIDYATGDNWATDEQPIYNKEENNCYKDADIVKTYILNTNSKKIHTPDCANAEKIAEHNKEVVETTLLELFAEGYEPGQCCIK